MSLDIIPHLSLVGNDYSLRLFRDPFADHCGFVDYNSGLYLIGHGSATVYVQFSSPKPGDSDKVLVDKLGYRKEFEIHASPESLDLPELRDYQGILAQSNLTGLNDSRLRSVARTHGVSYFERLFLPRNIKRKFEEILQTEESRSRIGQKVIKNYQGRLDIDDSLKELLKNYTKKKENGDVIPLAFGF